MLITDISPIAHQVMVLDLELLSIKHTTDEETLLRIMTCAAWMRRL